MDTGAQKYTIKITPSTDASPINAMHQIFVASSMEAKAQAKVLIRELANPDIKFRPWWETARPGRMFLSELAQVASEVTAALFVFTPDISGTFRRKRVKLPNQNVLFELGYFFNIVRPECIAIVKYGETVIPTDLLGYTHIKGSKFFKAGAGSATGKATRADFTKWIIALQSEVISVGKNSGSYKHSITPAKAIAGVMQGMLSARDKQQQSH